MPPYAPLLLLVAIGGGLMLWQEGGESTTAAGVITCYSPHVGDGDTFNCGGKRIRLANIDAPEMPGACIEGRRCTPGDPFAARDALRALTRGPVSCDPVDIDDYGRTVARCEGAAGDLSCAMVEGGHAVRRYGSLWCL